MVHWPVSKTDGEDEDDSVDAAERPLSSGSSTKSALTPEEEEQAKDLNETRQRNKMKEPGCGNRWCVAAHNCHKTGEP